MPMRGERGFVWVEREYTTKYNILINSINVTNDILSAEFSKGVTEEIGFCNISLENCNGRFNSLFSEEDEIELQLDFEGGTTSRFKGYIEKLVHKFGDISTYEIQGSHNTGKLLDITVTETYDGSLTSDFILKDLVSTYLSGYTTTNVESSTTYPTITWSNKTFWDCIVDLCKLSDFDCYLGDDNDFHFFAKNSKVNEEEAVIWSQNMLDQEGLGTDSIEVKNKIIVYGKDNAGVTIIYTAEDTDSQDTYGIKEFVHSDTNIKTYQQAKEFGDTKLEELKSTTLSGKTTSLLMPELNPGDLVWVSNPVQNIHGQYRIVKFTYKLPEEETICEFNENKKIPNVFKDLYAKELANTEIENPERMEHSYNLTFDDYTDIDQTASSNIEVSGGYLKLKDGYSSGTAYTKVRNTLSNIESVYLVCAGQTIPGTIFEVSANNGLNYKEISTATLSSITLSGTQLILKISLNSSNTQFDSIALLYTEV